MQHGAIYWIERGHGVINANLVDTPVGLSAYRFLAESNRFTSATMGMDMVRTPELRFKFCVTEHLCRFEGKFRLLLRALRQH
jgi:hypothetical protein